MKKKIVWITVVGVVCALAVYLSIPRNHFITKALRYQSAGIDDYKLFENRVVEAGTGLPWDQHPEYNSYTLTPEQVATQEGLQTVAFLVARDSQLLYEAYWDGYGPESHSNSFSMAKSIISLLIGCAVEDGYIASLDQPVGDFIPEFNQGQKANITIRHLLNMSSGLSWDEAYSSLFSVTTQAYYGKFLRELTLSQDVIAEPGVAFSYLSGDTQLLSFVLSAATGKTVSEYASERIWKPIGAESNALWSLDREGGVEKAYCCFNSNARDFARIGRLVLNSGEWNGLQVVPEWFIRESMAPATHLTDTDLGGKPNTRYAFQWWFVQHRGYQVKYARGILGQYIFIIPDLNLVAVRLGHLRSNERIEGHPIDVFQHIDLAISISEAVGEGTASN